MTGQAYQIRLRDGRRLGFRTWGDPEGTPLLEFRGLPSSRLGDTIADELLLRLRIRRITVDRPGVGLSDFQPGRTILAWPADVAELADRLRLDRFLVLGTSGGGPYAAACAHRLGARVVRTGLVSALGPMDRPGATAGMEQGERRAMEIARRAPWLLRGLMGALAGAERLRAGTIVAALLSTVPDCDRVVVARPEVAASLADSYRRAFARGTRGQVLDWALIDRPWGFDPSEIASPVLIWQGDLDGRVPLHHAEDLAARIPTCSLRIFAGEGHMIAFSRIEEILAGLVADLPRDRSAGPARRAGAVSGVAGQGMGSKPR